MIQTIGLMALCSALLLCVAGQVAHADTVDDYIKIQMHKKRIPGLSLAVVQDGKVVKAKGYGLANVETNTPATADTVYQLASVTKQFTATAIMMLVEEGKLHLEDKITHLLPDLPTAWDAVTVRHLLNHTSGIKSYTGVKDFDKTMRKDYTQRELLALVEKEPMEFMPGEQWNYNNTGFFLLGMLIEKVSGKQYGEFLKERIFQPLGMTHTRVNDLQVVIPKRAQGYSWNWNERAWRNGEYVSPTQPFAAGALVSTVNDLVKWDAALYTEKLLKKSALDQMWTPTPLSKGGTADYGFGWGVGKVNTHRVIEHGGGIPGFSTYIARFVDDRLTVIVLTNSDRGDAGALAKGVAGRILPVLAKIPEKPIPDTDPTTTERLKRALLGVQQGEMAPDLFTEELRQNIGPHVQEDRAMAAEFGTLKTFQLLERKTADSNVQLRYRAVFTNQTLTVFFSLDKGAKIAGLGLQMED